MKRITLIKSIGLIGLMAILSAVSATETQVIKKRIKN